ncbi:MAG: NUMOD3 domain-containing DNA-binding protein [Candidatus Woesearchaeota archaeon]
MVFKKGNVPVNKGKHPSEETRRKQSLSHLGIKYPNRKYTYSKSAFQKGHKINLGRHFPEEFGKKIVETRRKNNSYKVSEETKIKQSLAKTGKRSSEETKRKLSAIWSKPEYQKLAKERRAKQVFPLKDSLPEIKIQHFLKQLGIIFLAHKLITKIEHSYQCDIFIPSMNLIIEVDGDYWHGNISNSRFKTLNKPQIATKELDFIRTKELIEKGFNVLRLWESEIKKMNLQEFMLKVKPFGKLVNNSSKEDLNKWLV